jgi:hypothetical protein
LAELELSREEPGGRGGGGGGGHRHNRPAGGNSQVANQSSLLARTREQRARVAETAKRGGLSQPFLAKKNGRASRFVAAQIFDRSAVGHLRSNN